MLGRGNGIAPLPDNRCTNDSLEDRTVTTSERDIEATRNHVFHCRQYMDNALEALQKEEVGKAGEMIWGSFSQAVHAVDAWRGPVIHNHRSLMNYARDIGRELGDPLYPYYRQSARSLHENFYVPVETAEEVEELLPGIQQAINQILALLPEEVRNGAVPE